MAHTCSYTPPDPPSNLVSFFLLHQFFLLKRERERREEGWERGCGVKGWVCMNMYGFILRCMGLSWNVWVYPQFILSLSWNVWVYPEMYEFILNFVILQKNFIFAKKVFLEGIFGRFSYISYMKKIIWETKNTFFLLWEQPKIRI